MKRDATGPVVSFKKKDLGNGAGAQLPKNASPYPLKIC